MNNLVTVITATTGSKYLEDCIRSVQNQTYENIQHLIFIDGKERKDAALKIIEKFDKTEHIDLIQLPYPTGADGWNGHRMYAAGTYLGEGNYFSFLDDDNYFEPTHIESMLDNVTKRPNFWSYSLRNIVDENSNFVCQDNCESLGKWHTIIAQHDYFVDVNCYLLPRDLATAMTPVWNRKFRTPGIMEIDRAMYNFLIRNQPDFDCTYQYTVNYRAGNTERSVQKDFFIEGNKRMDQYLRGKLPWKK